MIKAEATFRNKNIANCMTEITGNGEAIAVEYCSITRALIEAEDGQAILDRAIDMMKKEINEHEEKRSK